MYGAYGAPQQPDGHVRPPMPPPRPPPSSAQYQPQQAPPPEDRLVAKRPAVTWGSADSVDKFLKIEQIGEGTYGEVRRRLSKRQHFN